MSIATLILLSVLHVQHYVLSLDDNGGVVSWLVEEVAVHLAIVDPLDACLLVNHGILETIDDFENIGLIQTMIGAKVRLRDIRWANVKVVPFP